MSRRLLWGIIILLIATNIATLIGFINYQSEGSIPLDVENKGKDLGKQVAIVGDSSIDREDWLQELVDAHGEKVLEQMIDREVVSKLADHYELKLNEKWIDRELSHLENTIHTFDEKTVKEMRKELRENIKYRLYLEELLTKDIVVEEQRIKAYFDENGDQLNFPKSYQLSHIVLDDDHEVQKVLAELEAGASFSMLAREYSIDPFTKDKGGYLGYYAEGNVYLPQQYYDILEQLNHGEYSSPFKTEEGTVILYLHRTLPEITFTYDEVKHAIKRRLALEQINVNQAKKYLWEEVGVEWIYEES